MAAKGAQAKFDANKYVTKNFGVAEIENLKMVFDVFDYDHGGSISIDELVSAAVALGREADVGQIINIVNSSGHSGDLDFAAFLDVFGFTNQEANTESTLQQIFEAFDSTHSGAFGPEEFERVAASVGEHFSAAEVDQMIEYADRDRDGVINFEEFSEIMTKKYPRA